MMVGIWQEVQLNDIAKYVYRPVLVETGNSYRTIGVRWWGMGAYERETIDGSRTAAKTLSIVREGDLIINKIWVRHGSVAIATKDVDGCAGSGEFPTFELDLNRIDPRWMHWQTKSNGFWKKCDLLSRGTSGKNRIKPELFLTITIPLPPLDEQQRILTRIEALAARVSEAHRLRREANHEAEVILESTLAKIFNKDNPLITPRSISDTSLIINRETRNPMQQPNKEFLYVDIASVENGTGKIIGPQKIFGQEAPSRAKRVIHHRDVIISTVRPYLKSFALVPEELDNQICSTGFAVFTCSDEIIPDFLLYQFFSPFFIRQAMDLVTGGHYPALNDKSIKAIKLMIPNIETQSETVTFLNNVMSKVNEIRLRQTGTQQELDALLPSILDKAFMGEL